MNRLSSHELTEWMCFAQLEPFGSEANYHGHAITAATVANVMRDPKKHEAFSPADFMPKFEENELENEQKSSEDLYAMFRIWAMIAGAKKK